MAHAQSAWTINHGGKVEDRTCTLQYGPRKPGYCVSDSFKFLKRVESKTTQFEIVFKSLARFSTQFIAKEIFKLLLSIY